MSGVLAPQYIHGVYIPSALLVVGVAIVKKEWLPYAALVAVVLGSWKVYINSTWSFPKLPLTSADMWQSPGRCWTPRSSRSSS